MTAARGERPLLCTKLNRGKEAALEDSARVEGGVGSEGWGWSPVQKQWGACLDAPLVRLVPTEISEELTTLRQTWTSV